MINLPKRRVRAWRCAVAVDTAGVSLLEMLAAELERPRPITAQVANYVSETYGVTRDGMGRFMEAEATGLEDYEIDLVFSPLFTPTLKDQVPFAELLGDEVVAPERWPGLIQQLELRPTRGQFVTEEGQTIPFQLRAVTLERFVQRLRLDGTIATELQPLIESVPQPSDRALLKAIARRASWEQAGRRKILETYLARMGGGLQGDDAVALLKLVETYEPADISELLRRIPHWQQVLRQEINDAGTKPFFNERVEELHGGGRDQRRQDNSRVAAKERELAFLGRLERVLAG